MEPQPKTNAIIGTLIFFCIALMITGATHYFQTHNRESQGKRNQAALQKELTITKDALGRETARRVSFQASNKDLLNTVAEKNGVIEHLQKEVAKSKNTQAVAIVTTETKTPFKAPTRVLPGTVDTVTKEVWPVYTAHDSTEFGKISVYASKDSTFGIYTNYEQGTFRQVNERAGFLRPKQAVVYYSSNNPNTHITGLNSYAVKPPPGRLWTFLKGTAAGAALVSVLYFIK